MKKVKNSKMVSHPNRGATGSWLLGEGESLFWREEEAIGRMPTPQWVTHVHVGSTNWTYGVLGKKPMKLGGKEMTWWEGHEGELEGGRGYEHDQDIHNKIFRKIKFVRSQECFHPPLCL